MCAPLPPPPSPASDEAQVSRAVMGDADALAALLERHGPPIGQSLEIARKWQSVVSADDVMQVTYLETFLRISDFVYGGPGSFVAWLRRIAENNLRDAIREQQRAKRPDPARRVEPNSQETYVQLVQILIGAGGTPSGAAATREAVDFLESALAKLPEDYETVIRLYELEGRAVREVAAVVGRSEGAVKMLLARARDHLRESMGSRSRYFSQ